MRPSSLRSLLLRLYQDLAELHDAPYPGISVFTNDVNVREFCLVLTPPSGPWKNMSLHFDVILPDNWPLSPPKVSSSVDGISHPNLFGDYICCDLLKDHVQREAGYSGGYTPALTLSGLFLQFLTFFSLSKVEQENGGYEDIGEAITVHFARESDLPGRKGKAKPTPGRSKHRIPTQDELLREWEKDAHDAVVISREMTEIGPLLETTKSSRPSPNRLHRIEKKNYRWTSTFKAIRYWQCKRCPYGTEALPHLVGAATGDVNPSPLSKAPAACLLHLLDDDVLYELSLRLPSESLITLSTAYPRLHDISQSRRVLLQRELRCFFLRTPLSESVLGIGLYLDFRARTLTSDFDWLSQRAFTEYGIRESVEKQPFSFFLPLAFSRPHFEHRAKGQMSRNPRPRSAIPQRPEIIFVIYRMMNNIVVSLMKGCDGVVGNAPSFTSQTLLHASEKAVIAYCHLFHLVISLSRTDPDILADATDRLRRFMERKDARLKTQVPDLGEFIVPIILVVCRPPVGSGPPIRWSESLAAPFLEEVLIRNARWVLKDAPHLEVLEHGSSDYRLAETFDRSKTSLRLVMFQITFLELFYQAYGHGSDGDIARLDDNYGFPEKDLPERMVEEVKQIYEIDTWPDFFEKVRYPQGAALGNEKLCGMLRDAVETSATRHYHKAASSSRLNLLRDQRRRVEEESARRLSKTKEEEEEVFRSF
ncbi:UBIQUITIN-CONJUGAT-2 domain-containing protein [Mycena venus]|uniref:UBIQUITIN-CONJUGAT-2 domain-containing protein n=1 Tax=Mycena venus TaxID=2733690 RepID=A0A8H7DA20_9AGAR|nr:UBIQUITIN-CONJUGAT-2 domain-containing protein [Mycena venus]